MPIFRCLTPNLISKQQHNRIKENIHKKGFHNKYRQQSLLENSSIKLLRSIPKQTSINSSEKTEWNKSEKTP